MRLDKMTDEEFRRLVQILLEYLCLDCRAMWTDLLGKEEEDE